MDILGAEYLLNDVFLIYEPRHEKTHILHYAKIRFVHIFMTEYCEHATTSIFYKQE